MINIILGENIHEEILKRVFPLFKFYSLKKGLDATIYDSLLKNWNEKHESIALKIEDLICDILPFISKQDKRYLFQKINELRYNSYYVKDDIDLNYLNFIKKFTIKSLNNEYNETNNNYSMVSNIGKKNEYIDITANENIYYGVDIFWELMLDSNGKKLKKKEDINHIFNSFVDILNSTSDYGIKESYLEKCFINIEEVSFKP